jgi:hypothetical protein
VANCCECSDEPSGSCATDLIQTPPTIQPNAKNSTAIPTPQDMISSKEIEGRLAYMKKNIGCLPSNIARLQEKEYTFS